MNDTRKNTGKEMDVFGKLFGLSLVAIEGCWNECCGFCCSNNHPDFNFRFMTINGTEIIYLPQEYDWAEKYRKTFHNQTGQIPHAIELDIGEFGIGIIYEKCQLKGKCDDLIDKPLLCRLYPFLPVFSYQGVLEDLFPASVFDLTFEAAGFPHSCSIIKNKKSEYVELFRNNRIAGSLDTYVKFYLRCVWHFASLMSQGVKENAELMAKKGKDFWQYWEKLHLTGQLFDVARLKALVKLEYDEARNFDPDFSLIQERGLIKKIRKGL